MRLFFKAGGFDDHSRGWYRFWVARSGRNSMVFRMPEKATIGAVSRQAYEKLLCRDWDMPDSHFRIIEADEASVIRWLMGHRKKAGLGEYGR